MNVDSMWTLEPLKDGHQDDTPNWIHYQNDQKIRSEDDLAVGAMCFSRCCASMEWVVVFTFEHMKNQALSLGFLVGTCLEKKGPYHWCIEFIHLIKPPWLRFGSQNHPSTPPTICEKQITSINTYQNARAMDDWSLLTFLLWSWFWQSVSWEIHWWYTGS